MGTNAYSRSSGGDSSSGGSGSSSSDSSSDGSKSKGREKIREALSRGFHSGGSIGDIGGGTGQSVTATGGGSGGRRGSGGGSSRGSSSKISSGSTEQTKQQQKNVEKAQRNIATKKIGHITYHTISPEGEVSYYGVGGRKKYTFPSKSKISYTSVDKPGGLGTQETSAYAKRKKQEKTQILVEQLNKESSKDYLTELKETAKKVGYADVQQTEQGLVFIPPKPAKTVAELSFAQKIHSSVSPKFEALRSTLLAEEKSKVKREFSDIIVKFGEKEFLSDAKPLSVQRRPLTDMAKLMLKTGNTIKDITQNTLTYMDKGNLHVKAFGLAVKEGRVRLGEKELAVVPKGATVDIPRTYQVIKEQRERELREKTKQLRSTLPYVIAGTEKLKELSQTGLGKEMSRQSDFFRRGSEKTLQLTKAGLTDLKNRYGEAIYTTYKTSPFYTGVKVLRTLDKYGAKLPSSDEISKEFARRTKKVRLYSEGMKEFQTPFQRMKSDLITSYKTAVNVNVQAGLGIYEEYVKKPSSAVALVATGGFMSGVSSLKSTSGIALSQTQAYSKLSNLLFKGYVAGTVAELMFTPFEYRGKVIGENVGGLGLLALGTKMGGGIPKTRKFDKPPKTKSNVVDLNYPEYKVVAETKYPMSKTKYTMTKTKYPPSRRLAFTKSSRQKNLPTNSLIVKQKPMSVKYKTHFKLKLPKGTPKKSKFVGFANSGGYHLPKEGNWERVARLEAIHSGESIYDRQGWGTPSNFKTMKIFKQTGETKRITKGKKSISFVKGEQEIAYGTEKIKVKTVGFRESYPTKKDKVYFNIGKFSTEIEGSNIKLKSLADTHGFSKVTDTGFKGFEIIQTPKEMGITTYRSLKFVDEGGLSRYVIKSTTGYSKDVKDVLFEKPQDLSYDIQKNVLSIKKGGVTVVDSEIEGVEFNKEAVENLFLKPSKDFYLSEELGLPSKKSPDSLITKQNERFVDTLKVTTQEQLKKIESGLKQRDIIKQQRTMDLETFDKLDMLSQNNLKQTDVFAGDVIFKETSKSIPMEKVYNVEEVPDDVSNKGKFLNGEKTDTTPVLSSKPETSVSIDLKLKTKPIPISDSILSNKQKSLFKGGIKPTQSIMGIAKNRTESESIILNIPMQSITDITKQSNKLENRQRYKEGIKVRTESETNIINTIDTDTILNSHNKGGISGIDYPKPPTIPDIPPPEEDITYIPKVKKFFIPQSIRMEDKPKDTFKVLVREKGKDLRVNKKGLPRNKALNFGGDIVVNTPSASYKIIKIKGKQKVKDDPFFKYHFMFRKSKKDPKRLVEKKQFRIDTSGEIQGISVKGYLAKMRNKKFSLL